jgi:hypothetical protein
MRLFCRFEIPFLALGTAFWLSVPALAEPTDWSELAAHPDLYIGQQVEIGAAYCASGGVNGDAPGYQCSTPGALYIVTPDIAPANAKQRVDENCGGLDVIERSAFCRATILFVPRSFKTSTELEPGKTVTVIETDGATLSF